MNPEAEGEVGIEACVGDLGLGQLAPVPVAHGDLPGLAHAPAEEPLRHALHGRAAHAGQDAQLRGAADHQAVVLAEHEAVGEDVVADEFHGRVVAQEAAERVGDAAAGLRDLEHEAAVAAAELQRARAAEGGRPLHAHADRERLAVAEAVVATPQRGVHPAARDGGARGNHG